MATVDETKAQQAPADEAKARQEPEVVEGGLREALNRGDYGVDYQRSDYSQDAEQDPVIHAENEAQPAR